MIIDKNNLQHIAKLANLKLNLKETDLFSKQLESILGYMDKLKEVNTEQIPITAQVSSLTNVWRADEVKPWDLEEIEAALSQGERESRYIKVKRVL